MANVLGLSAIANFFKVQYVTDKPIIDSVIFRSHYRYTTSIFFGCCILVTLTSMFGQPIQCIMDTQADFIVNAINTYCWIAHTYTLPPERGQVFAGVGAVNKDDNSEPRYHAYYQWVPFMLFFHGLSFYVPHWIWKCYEAGKIKMLTEQIRGRAMSDTEERKKKRKELVSYLVTSLHSHNLYAAVYFFCDLLNFVNIIATMYFINRFLAGTFWSYGTEVLQFTFTDENQRTDPMSLIFPRMTKCDFNKGGPSGSVQKYDSLCLLAVNNVNEKIYIFIWFWLLLLSIITVVSQIYNLALIFMPMFRQGIIATRFKYGKRNMDNLIKRTQIGDFLVLHFLGQNLNTMTYHDLLEDMNEKLDKNSRNKRSTIELDPYYPNDQLLSEKLNLNDHVV